MNILQSTSWEKFLKDEGDEVYRLEGQNYSALCVLKHTPMGNYLMLPYGPNIESGKDLKTALKEVQKLAEEKGAIFIRIEPTVALTEKTIAANNLKKVKNVDPQSTVVLDLTKSEDEILAGFDKKKRQYYRNYINKGITIRQSDKPEEIEIMFKFYEGLTEKRGFSLHEKSYMTNQLKQDFAKLYVIELEGEPIGASLIYDYEDTRYYAYAAYSEQHKNNHTNDILLGKMIFDAKADGKTTFDFWGATTSEDPNDPWYGFTKYKLSFGGEIKTYAGTYDIILNKTKYNLYTALRKVNRIKRKIIKK